jgi:hypothetical protein
VAIESILKQRSIVPVPEETAIAIRDYHCLPKAKPSLLNVQNAYFGWRFIHNQGYSVWLRRVEQPRYQERQPKKETRPTALGQQRALE